METELAVFRGGPERDERSLPPLDVVVARDRDHRCALLQVADPHAGRQELAVPGSLGEVPREHDDVGLEFGNPMLGGPDLLKIALDAEVRVGHVDQGETHRSADPETRRPEGHGKGEREPDHDSPDPHLSPDHVTRLQPHRDIDRDRHRRERSHQQRDTSRTPVDLPPTGAAHSTEGNFLLTLATRAGGLNEAERRLRRRIPESKHSLPNRASR